MYMSYSSFLLHLVTKEMFVYVIAVILQHLSEHKLFVFVTAIIWLHFLQHKFCQHVMEIVLIILCSLGNYISILTKLFY